MGGMAFWRIKLGAQLHLASEEGEIVEDVCKENVLYLQCIH